MSKLNQMYLLYLQTCNTPGYKHIVLGSMYLADIEAHTVEEMQGKILCTLDVLCPQVLTDIEGREIFYNPESMSAEVFGDNGIVTLEFIECKWI